MYREHGAPAGHGLLSGHRAVQCLRVCPQLVGAHPRHGVDAERDESFGLHCERDGTGGILVNGEGHVWVTGGGAVSFPTSLGADRGRRWTDRAGQK